MGGLVEQISRNEALEATVGTLARQLGDARAANAELRDRLAAAYRLADHLRAQVQGLRAELDGEAAGREDRPGGRERSGEARRHTRCGIP